MLELRGLARTMGDFALNVDLELASGAIGAILGPSGCGKSTLLRLVAGLEHPEAGSIELEGRRLDSLPPEARGVGLVFQDFALFPNMSALRNIEYGPRMRGEPRAGREAKARLLASSLGLSALLERQPSSLSGGEQQRVALARTLAAEPRLVLLDEPLSSLDAGLRRRLRGEIAERLREAGVMALHVTHDVEEALAIADRVYLMENGRITETGSPEEVYLRPRLASTARFVGRGPVIPAEPGSPGLLRTALGDFAWPIGVGPGGPGRLALFFAADAGNLLPWAEAGRPNTLRGRVVSASFLGRCRRVVMDCGQLILELDLDPGAMPRRGENLCFDIPPDRCMLVTEEG